MSRISLKPSEEARSQGYTEIVVGLDKMFGQAHWFYQAYKEDSQDEPVLWRGLTPQDAPSRNQVIEFIRKYAKDCEHTNRVMSSIVLDLDPGLDPKVAVRQSVVVSDSLEHVEGVGEVRTIMLGSPEEA